MRQPGDDQKFHSIPVAVCGDDVLRRIRSQLGLGSDADAAYAETAERSWRESVLTCTAATGGDALMTLAIYGRGCAMPKYKRRVSRKQLRKVGRGRSLSYGTAVEKSSLQWWSGCATARRSVSPGGVVR